MQRIVLSIMNKESYQVWLRPDIDWASSPLSWLIDGTVMECKIYPSRLPKLHSYMCSGRHLKQEEWTSVSAIRVNPGIQSTCCHARCKEDCVQSSCSKFYHPSPSQPQQNLPFPSIHPCHCFTYFVWLPVATTGPGLMSTSFVIVTVVKARVFPTCLPCLRPRASHLL
jgi:hypothetical protein